MRAYFPLLEKLHRSLAKRGLVWVVLPRRTTVVGSDTDAELFAVETPFPNFDQVITAGLDAFAHYVAEGRLECLIEDTTIVTKPIEDIAGWIDYQRGATIDPETLEAALASLDIQRSAFPNATLADRENQSLHIYRKCL